MSEDRRVEGPSKIFRVQVYLTCAIMLLDDAYQLGWETAILVAAILSNLFDETVYEVGG